MEFPQTVRAALEERAAGIPPRRLKEIAQAVSRRYRESSAAGERLVSSDEETLVYALTRMPATFGAVCAALSQALPGLSRMPATLLDVGAGTGAAAFAAASVLDLEEVTCLEREPSMIRLGSVLTKEDPVLQKACWIQGDLACGGLSALFPKKAELVVASYVLNELREQERPAVLSRLWEAAESLLLLVEPGTPRGFAGLLAARNQLLNEGAYMAAPCPHEGICPHERTYPLENGPSSFGDSSGKEDWCHFSCRIARSRLHKQLKEGDAPYEDEKFACLALSKTPCVLPKGRVLRHPYTEPGKITLRLCTASGPETAILRKRDGTSYKQARKAAWGEAFPPLEEHR